MTPGKITFSALRVLALLAVVLGGLWFWARLSYDDEQPRVQANEGPAAVTDIMTALQMFYAENRHLPKSGELKLPPAVSAPHVTAVAVSPDYVLTVVYHGRREIDGKRLVLTPVPSADGKLAWTCSLPEIDPRWWPDYCRPATRP